MVSSIREQRKYLIEGMSTTERHMQILAEIEFSIRSQFRSELLSGRYKLTQEQQDLVYNGKNEVRDYKLIDCSVVQIIPHINDLSFVAPDLMLFTSNPYIQNDNKTKYAGCPNLIVEVWSKSNREDDIEFKKYLYASGKNTEHWYIEHNSDIVECCYEDRVIAKVSFSQILVTSGGISIDLSPLALS